MFLMLAKEPKDNLFEINGCSEDNKKLFELRQQINFYESALINYNILIDYSWQLVYFCFEYVYYDKQENVGLDNMIEINEARKILNKLEKDVKCPLNEESPIHYFEKFNVDSEYKEVFDLINNFWNGFKDTELRNNYNKLKHCGNLLYEEEQALIDTRIKCTCKINGKKIPTSAKDLRQAISLNKSIEDLKDFDDNLLTGYLSKLLNALNSIIELPDLAFLP